MLAAWCCADSVRVLSAGVFSGQTRLLASFGAPHSDKPLVFSFRKGLVLAASV